MNIRRSFLSVDTGEVDVDPLLLRLAVKAAEQEDHDEHSEDGGDPEVIGGDSLANRMRYAMDVGLDEQVGHCGQANTSNDCDDGHDHEGDPLALMNGDLDVLRRTRNAGELADPLAPEHERCGRAVGKHDDEGDLTLINES